MFVEILCHIFFYDVWFFFSHIILHNKHIYKTIHKTHHLVDYRIMKYTDTYVAHYWETPFQGVGILFPLFFIHFNPYSFLISVLFISIRGLMRHDHHFVWIIGNHHILHHKHPRYNFGEYWLDVLFGTNYPNKEEYVYGILYI
jgi:sterol desaturase/sphingolipid hydroxylase (fatty acid hydroxylase superfamily)